MSEFRFDHPLPEMPAEEAAATLTAIEQGVAQLDAGRGIPLEEVRAELAKRCLSHS